ncbi:MAG: beta-N-acetylhexosaminidase [Alphaproteobacteria bacterium]|nr:beta-N-acetylhexosaminidase [Alphaproteobacteria bacterium]
MFHPVITDVEGLEISAEERALFKEFRPYGFILFQRNCDNPDQVKKLTDQMKEIIGNPDAPILIDQEGGRVARLKPPHWPNYPAAGAYSKLYDDNPELAAAAVQVHARLIASDLLNVGVNVDCFPVADIFYEGADKVIGDRAYGDYAEKVTRLARAAAEGMIAGGVTPVIKHIPGHGRADVDSHKSLPRVDTALDELKKTDFIPFRKLNDFPCAMTAHVIYSAIDSEKCATVSRKIIGDIIRGEIAFRGVLFSDDLSMKALNKAPEQNALDALEAGCDLALHCNGNLEARHAVLKATIDKKLEAENRLDYFFKKKRISSEIDHDQLYDWLSGVMKGYE